MNSHLFNADGEQRDDEEVMMMLSDDDEDDDDVSIRCQTLDSLI